MSSVESLSLVDIENIDDRPKVIWFVREDIFPEGQVGGMGVHVWKLAHELSSMYDLTVVGASGKHDGGFYVVGPDNHVQVDYAEWKPTFGHFRYLRLFNENLYHINERDDLLHDWVYPQSLLKNWALFLKDEKFEIIHCHDTHFWEAADVLRKYYKCPIVTSCHLSTAISYPDFPKIKYWQYLVNREGVAYFNSDYLLTCSDWYANQMHDEFGLHQKDINVFYNGIDMDEFKDIDSNTIRNKYDCNKLVVFVGRLDRMKGIEVFLKMPERFPDWHFIMISRFAMTDHDTLLSQQVEDFAKSHDNFEWIVQGSDKEKLEYMNNADVMIMPSLAEPFGIVALEAHALGVPLVVSNYAGLKEHNNETDSWLFDVVYNNGIPDIDATAKNLIRTLEEFEYDENKIRNGYETAKSFNWKQTADVHNKLYEEILK